MSSKTFKTSPRLSDTEIRESLIKAGIKNLTTFGYTNVTKKNIFTEYVLNRFFLSMLNSDENKTTHFQLEKVRLALIKEVEDHVKSAA